MNTFQKLYDSILHLRASEKPNPFIKQQIGHLGIQIYANNPLQFNLMYGDIFAQADTRQEMDLQFVAHEVSGKRTFSVSIVNPESTGYKEKCEFGLDEGIERLAEEFQGVECVREIVDCLLRYSLNE